MLAISKPLHHEIIDQTDLADRTKWNYKRAIDRMIAAHIDPRDKTALTFYAKELPFSIRRDTKAALSLLYKSTKTDLKASARPDNIATIQATLYNLEAMTEVIHTKKEAGTKTHTWLSREQVEQITSLPDLSTARGRRDYIVLAILLGAGLRREELTNITFSDLLQQPTKTGMRDVLSVLGKGNKRRSIPISEKLAKHLRDWHKLAGDGYIVRAINKAGTINGSLSAIGIHNIVRTYGAMIDIPELDSHDLRRTYARLGYNAGVPVEQISKLLGHADVKTTMLYLGIDIDIESTISDFIPLSGD